MGRKSGRLLAVLGAAIALGIGSGPGAQAQSSSDGGSKALAKHCVIQAAANVEKPVTTTRCFSTFEQAISVATGGATKVKPGQRTLTAEELAPTAAASSTVVGIEYEDSNFGGWSYILAASGVFSCTTSTYVNFNSLPSGVDNEISSARSYANCKSGHFEYTNNGGSVRICGCSTMGTMSDKTSSIRFSYTGL